ncbi:ArsR/SmtB family transcription factor [Phaeacidiphilus oryzae]|uniref:ArsR/SmtB family transcription factor n=1 Tax=Phaeacidiphilus oryzae TaxID=348818 RepID=UPI000A01DEFB|nr:metalloregulator ArsR/SmtB family transcription factor [Phaeacidiphilus oryzae]
MEPNQARALAPAPPAAAAEAAPGDADISQVGALLADPARCRVLMALNDGRALPAGVLAEEAGVSRSTASGHLARLTEAGLLAVKAQGRHRYYRLSGPEVGELLERISRLAPARPVRSLRDGNRAARLRSARTCYDHLAGRLGVELMAALIRDGHLTGGDGLHHLDEAGADRLSGRGREVDYALGPAAADFLTGLGVPLGEAAGRRRPLVRYCVDWSEQRHHLAGGLGRALLDRFLDAEWIVRPERGRAVRVTDTGRDVLRSRFGIDWE